MKYLAQQILTTMLVAGGLTAHGEAIDCDVFAEAFGGVESEAVNCVIATSDGCYVATGYTYGAPPGGKNFLLAKFDSEGEFLWKTIFGGGEDEEGRSVIETHDGDLLVVGYTKSVGDGADFLLARFNSDDGSPQWARTWGAGSGYDEKLFAVIEASDNTVWATGFTDSYVPQGRRKVIVARINPGGAVLTCARAGKLADDWTVAGYALTEVFDTGGICVTGTVIDPDLFGFGQEILLAKFSLDPGYLWAYRIGLQDEHDEVATSIVRTSDGCLALCGSETDWVGPETSYHAVLLKTDINAICDWGRLAPGTTHYVSRNLPTVITTNDDHLVAVGKDHGGVWYEDRIVVTKWDFAGNEVWNRGYEFGDTCLASSVAEDVDASLMLAGSTEGYGQGGKDVLLVKCQYEGLTCMPDLGGPDYQNWSPEQTEIALSYQNAYPVSTEDWLLLTGPYEMFITPICGPTVHTVCPDGTADFERIQDAIDFADECDIVELCDATFSGDGNQDLDFQGKSITVRSQSGDPEMCTIEFDAGDGHRGFHFHNEEGPCAILEGVTIRNAGSSSQLDHGGGIYLESASPTITNCRFADCSAAYGGGICCSFASPTISDCLFYNNYADNDGGAVYCEFSDPQISGCTFAGNDTFASGGAASERVQSHSARSSRTRYARRPAPPADCVSNG